MAQASRVKGFAVTIAIGQSLSNEIDLQGDGDWLPVAIVMSAGWDAAAITALGRDLPGQTAGNVYDSAGEWTLPSAQIAGGRYMLLTALSQLRVRFLTLRSGTSGAPVAQAGGTRNLWLVCRGRD